MIFQALVKSEKLDLNTLSETEHIIQYIITLTLTDNNKYAYAKLSIVPMAVSNIINLYQTFKTLSKKQSNNNLQFEHLSKGYSVTGILNYLLGKPSDRNAEE